MGSKFLYALGYNTPENYIVYFTPEQVVVGEKTRMVDYRGVERDMKQSDVEKILADVPRDSRRRYRAIASLYISGKPLGPFRYHGVRADDPNDIVPHEHRRDLRGYRVFAAWLNHDDSRSVNTLDTFMPMAEGRGWVRHHLIDFSSALGSGSTPQKEIAPQATRPGNEYIVEIAPALKTAVTLGLWERPWRKIEYQAHPEIGRIEADYFRPETWKPEYPNPAFERMLPDDAFWAARIVSRFTDEMVRALVHTGQYDDPAAERQLADILIKRRDKTVAYYFRQVNPLSQFEVVSGADGSSLRFRNLGQEAGLGRADAYEYQWFGFDNLTHALTPLGAPSQSVATEIAVPAAGGEYRMARIRTRAAEPNWMKTVDVYLRGDRLVGIERDN
jgi:hypothetical protein